jgi:membrane protease subunit HflK
VLGSVDKVIIDKSAGTGVVPYLPLDQVTRPTTSGGVQ